MTVTIVERSLYRAERLVYGFADTLSRLMDVLVDDSDDGEDRLASADQMPWPFDREAAPVLSRDERRAS